MQPAKAERSGTPLFPSMSRMKMRMRFARCQQKSRSRTRSRAAWSSMVVTYALNKSTGKFHYPTCDSVADIKAKNRMDVDWTREKVIAGGYQPCGGCKP